MLFVIIFCLLFVFCDVVKSENIQYLQMYEKQDFAIGQWKGRVKMPGQKIYCLNLNSQYLNEYMVRYYKISMSLAELPSIHFILEYINKENKNVFDLSISLFNSDIEAQDNLLGNISKSSIVPDKIKVLHFKSSLNIHGMVDIKNISRSDEKIYGDHTVIYGSYNHIAFTKNNAYIVMHVIESSDESNNVRLVDMLANDIEKIITSQLSSIDNRDKNVKLKIKFKNDKLENSNANLNIKSTKMNNEVSKWNDNRSQHKEGKDEELERKLKSMPKAEAQEYCLGKALELAETPKDHEEELALYLRGIPVPEETQVSKLLHRICDNSQDVELLDAVARIQGKWLSREAEQREIMLADLTALLESDNGRLRAMAVQALGRSSSLDALPTLLKILEKDGYNHDEVLSAILKLLGSKANRKALSEEQIKSIKIAARQYLKALENLREATILDNQTDE